MDAIAKGERYWLDDSDEAILKQTNREFEQPTPLEQLFLCHFHPAENEEEGDWMTPMEILSFLQTKTKDRLSINKVALFGRALHKLGISSSRKTKGTENQVIFDRNAVEFVTVAAEFCKFLEQAEGVKRSAFVDTSLKILPLLYLKASMLPECETIGDEAPETFVTEETYEVLRMNLANILAEKDDYLDVFVSDMMYSDQPITRNISEDLADIYQDIKDFIFVFQLGFNETMNDSLAICQENFRLHWGQKLVNTLRALHEVKYAQGEDEEEETADFEY